MPVAALAVLVVTAAVYERRRSREMFVRLFHLPSHAQCNFGEACAIIERMVGSAVLYYELLSWWWRCKSPKKTP